MSVDESPQPLCFQTFLRNTKASESKGKKEPQIPRRRISCLISQPGLAALLGTDTCGRSREGANATARLSQTARDVLLHRTPPSSHH